ncbi:hypothetical protein HZC09_00235 [Candidatus Micrarchaeota archaeon]|nr:hypothetical protein [Candidatus Micrarchaeota archaeon]
MEDCSWLDEFLDSLDIAVANMDLATLQPTSWRHFQPLIAREWAEWFGRIVEEAKLQGTPYEKIAEAMPPDVCREHLFFTLEDLKTARVPKRKRLEIADFFYQTLKAQMEGEDYFGLHETNRKKIDLKKTLAKTFHKGTPEAAKALGRLYNAAYNLGAALYLDFYMGKAIENYGPYRLGGNRTLVIKEMRFLRPTELWQKRKGVAADHLRWYAVYENVKFSCDLVACHTNYEGDPIAGLREWRLERNGEQITDAAEIKKITVNIAENASKQWTELLALPEQKLLEKAVWIRCYVFKELCDLLELDWKPSTGLLGAVKGKNLAQGWANWKQQLYDEKGARKYWRKITDPRIDFYP